MSDISEEQREWMIKYCESHGMSPIYSTAWKMAKSEYEKLHGSSK